MLSIKFLTLQELQSNIAHNVRAKRLEQNLTQLSLSKKSGVSYGVLKKFEHTGQISLNSLLKLAISLGCVEDFEGLFALKKPEMALTLDELMKDDILRKRGRK